MGYWIIHFTCVSCGRMDAGNPNLVPSLRVKWDEDGKPVPSVDGQREPLCQICATTLSNELRAKGETPPVIHPDAYSPAPEGGF